MDKAPTSTDGLRGSIRARLRDRTLPPTDGRAWAGKGREINQCICCGMRTERSDQEYEPQEQPGLHAHAGCFTIWLAESLALRSEDHGLAAGKRPEDLETRRPDPRPRSSGALTSAGGTRTRFLRPAEAGRSPLTADDGPDRGPRAPGYG